MVMYLVESAHYNFQIVFTMLNNIDKINLTIHTHTQAFFFFFFWEYTYQLPCE